MTWLRSFESIFKNREDAFTTFDFINFEVEFYHKVFRGDPTLIDQMIKPVRVSV